jgi:hypothetical protein
MPTVSPESEGLVLDFAVCVPTMAEGGPGQHRQMVFLIAQAELERVT